jgi:hypothetical protein
VVKLGGAGFDTANGVAVDLFCACTGGKIPTIFINPGSAGLTPSGLTITLPAASVLSTGPGSFVVSNKGADGSYGKKSNAVSVPVGAQISVSAVTQSGTTVTVDGGRLLKPDGNQSVQHAEQWRRQRGRTKG